MSMWMCMYVYVSVSAHVSCSAMSLCVISARHIKPNDSWTRSSHLFPHSPFNAPFPLSNPWSCACCLLQVANGQVGITTKANGTSPSWNHNYGHRDISQLDAFTASHEGSTLSTFLPHFMGILQLGIWRLSHVASHLLNHLNNQLLNNRASPKNLKDKSLKKTALLRRASKWHMPNELAAMECHAKKMHHRVSLRLSQCHHHHLSSPSSEPSWETSQKT